MNRFRGGKKTEAMLNFVVKVQPSQAASDGVKRVLVYDAGRLLMSEVEVDDETHANLMELGGRTYFYAALTSDGVLHLGEPCEVQDLDW